MPTYEYECKANGHRFEVRQSFSDPALDACQVCGEPVRKVFSAAGIVFKGSGYYVTDSRPSPKGDGGGGKKDAAKKDGAKKDGAADGGSSGSSDAGGGSSTGTASGSGSSGSATPKAAAAAA
jgi:putative FmdB family regulatory protein